MSQYLINATDLPSGTLPTTPVVIKDNDLAGMFNYANYKYYQYGIPELTYIKFNGNSTVVKSTNIIQAVENGYYPIIIVNSNSSPSDSGTQIKSTNNLRIKPVNDAQYPSSQLYPGIWGFSYYFYKNSIPYAMFQCLQSFKTSSSSAVDNIQLREISYRVTDYLGVLDAPVVDSIGNWYSTIELFTKK